MTAPDRIRAILDRVRHQMQFSVCSHALLVNEQEGRYDFDCSGMAAWILWQATPVALQATGSPGPLPADIFRTIARTPVQDERFGWRGVSRIEDTALSDVLAWQMHPVVSERQHRPGSASWSRRPRGIQNVDGPWLVREADTSRFHHDHDSRMGATGFRVGTILATTDLTTGEGTGYGWYGARSEVVVPARVVLGRVSRQRCYDANRFSPTRSTSALRTGR